MDNEHITFFTILGKLLLEIHMREMLPPQKPCFQLLVDKNSKGKNP